MADLLERMEARIELRRMILSLRRSRDLQTQQDKQAATRMKQPIVIAMAATARGSEAQASWSIFSSASTPAEASLPFLRMCASTGGSAASAPLLLKQRHPCTPSCLAKTSTPCQLKVMGFASSSVGREDTVTQ
ncbi:hypothetical protein E2C01_010981 [Portunus trituberculatus]|uniref:Uncharacterized protein n=1 Tax=Portunus trituberculatus TaxID=210409 RepID=A0A5B7DA31_PORTR|nr:hypothetical protein [Portunus trituberculatus]